VYPNPIVDKRITIVCRLMRTNDIIAVYTLSGALVQTYLADNDIIAQVNLTDIQTGIYVLKVKNQSIKIVVI
jgi:hypothetical protein